MSGQSKFTRHMRDLQRLIDELKHDLVGGVFPVTEDSWNTWQSERQQELPDNSDYQMLLRLQRECLLLDQRKIGAMHQAGHVVMCQHLGYFTTFFIVDPDGMGYHAWTCLRKQQLKHDVDMKIAGPVAEDIFLGRDQTPNRRDIYGIIGEVSSYESFIDPEDEDYECDEDYESAVRLLNRLPDKQTVRVIQHSYNRCRKVIKRYWAIVEQLAAEALKDSHGRLMCITIQRIWESAGKSRVPVGACHSDE